MPANLRGAVPVSPAKAMTPRAPAVAPPTPPPAPVLTKKFDSEPPSGGWDAADADTVTSFPNPSDLPAPTPRNLPQVKVSPIPAAGVPATQASPPTNVPATPHSPGTVRGPYQTSPGVGGPPPDTAARAPALPAAARLAATTAVLSASASSVASAGPGGLGSAMREEVWAIVRAAVDEAVSPLLVRNKELEARVERAERFAEAAKGGARPVGAGIPIATTAVAAPPAGAASAAARLAALGQSMPPIAVSIAPPAAPAPAGRAEASPGSENISDRKPAAPVAAHPVGPRPSPSLPPAGSYGVTVMPSMRPQLDLDSVGAVDISGFDGGRSKRRVATAVVVIMLLIVAAVVTTTLLSHS